MFEGGIAVDDVAVAILIAEIFFRDVLSEEGSAVDAAVAILFCNSVVTSQSMGIGKI